MSEYRALCERLGKCIVCGQPFADSHTNQSAHPAPIIAKAMKDYRDGLDRGREDYDGHKPIMSEKVLANIDKVSQAFVIGYRKAVKEERLREEAQEWRDRTWEDQYFY